MSEKLPKNNETEPLIACSVIFEFDDPRFRIIDNQKKRGKALTAIWQQKLIEDPPPNLIAAQPIKTTRQDTYAEVGILGVEWIGKASVLTDGYAIEQAAVSVLGLIRDCGFTNMTFSKASFERIDQLDVFEIRKNITIDVTRRARRTEAELWKLDDSIDINDLPPPNQ